MTLKIQILLYYTQRSTFLLLSRWEVSTVLSIKPIYCDSFRIGAQIVQIAQEPGDIVVIVGFTDTFITKFACFPHVYVLHIILEYLHCSKTSEFWITLNILTNQKQSYLDVQCRAKTTEKLYNLHPMALFFLMSYCGEHILIALKALKCIATSMERMHVSCIFEYI